MRVRVLCDTNVLVSALIAEGPPSRVLEAAIDGRLELVLPVVVLDELARVLADKLGFADEQIVATRRLLELLAAGSPGKPAGVEAVTGDPDDDVVLACAVEAQVEALVTGDRRHLLPLGVYRGVRLLTPQALLAELAKAG